jgi:hypothetical protein
MKITITAPGQYMEASKEIPIVGRSYNLEDAATGTDAQNRAFHALVQEYWISGAHSYSVSSFEEFRNIIKRNLGAGFEAFIYVEVVAGRPVIRDAKKYQDIPAAIRRDPDMKKMVRGRLKSWAHYTKNERRHTIDGLIAEMHQVGVNSKKFQEILEGMEEEK